MLYRIITTSVIYDSKNGLELPVGSEGIVTAEAFMDIDWNEEGHDFEVWTDRVDMEFFGILDINNGEYYLKRSQFDIIEPMSGDWSFEDIRNDDELKLERSKLIELLVERANTRHEFETRYERNNASVEVNNRSIKELARELGLDPDNYED